MPVVIFSATTGDAAPLEAPHRISDKPTKNLANLLLRFANGDGSVPVVRAWRVTVGGDRKSGKVLAREGLVCGLDRCGTGPALSVPGNFSRPADLSFENVYDGGADGDRDIEINGMTDGGAWL